MPHQCVGVDLSLMLTDKHLDQWCVSILSSKVKWRHAEFTLGADVRLVIEKNISYLLMTSLCRQVQCCFTQLQMYVRKTHFKTKNRSVFIQQYKSVTH